MLDKKEMKKLLARRPDGVIVHAPDGRAFFLSNAAQRRTALSAAARSRVAKLMKKNEKRRGARSNRRSGGTGPAHPSFNNCANLYRWLTSHNPHTQRWREICVWWIEEC
jgi:hypothetical protein